MEFNPFPKIPRLMRDIVITEKIDGTNAQVNIRSAPLPCSNDPLAPFDLRYDIAVKVDPGELWVRAGSRSRWIRPDDDNYGFAVWTWDNAYELAQLGPGAHFGEWWGQGIQRNYSQTRKHFSLFNVHRWGETRPACCDVVPVLYAGEFNTSRLEGIVHTLAKNGSVAAPGFMKPEGIIVFHTAANAMFKRTIEKDDAPK